MFNHLDDVIQNLGKRQRTILNCWGLNTAQIGHHSVTGRQSTDTANTQNFGEL